MLQSPDTRRRVGKSDQSRARASAFVFFICQHASAHVANARARCSVFSYLYRTEEARGVHKESANTGRRVRHARRSCHCTSHVPTKAPMTGASCRIKKAQHLVWYTSFISARTSAAYACRFMCACRRHAQPHARLKQAQPRALIISRM